MLIILLLTRKNIIKSTLVRVLFYGKRVYKIIWEVDNNFYLIEKKQPL